MNPTRMTGEGAMPRQLAQQHERGFPLSISAGNRSMPALSGDELAECVSGHVFLKQLAAAIDAFADRLLELGPTHTGMVQGKMRIVSSRSCPAADQGKGRMGPETVFAVSASLVCRIGSAASRAP